MLFPLDLEGFAMGLLFHGPFGRFAMSPLLNSADPARRTLHQESQTLGTSFGAWRGALIPPAQAALKGKTAVRQTSGIPD